MRLQAFRKTVNRVSTRYDDPKFRSDKEYHVVPRRIVTHPEIKTVLVWTRPTYGGYIEIHGKKVFDCGGYATASAVRDRFQRYIKKYLSTEELLDGLLLQYPREQLLNCIGKIKEAYR